LVSCRPEDALAVLIEAGDDAVAVGFTHIAIACFPPTSAQGVVKVGGLQTRLSASVHECSVIRVPHFRTPACQKNLVMLIPSAASEVNITFISHAEPSEIDGLHRKSLIFNEL
jgi:hypothetical protein